MKLPPFARPICSLACCAVAVLAAFPRAVAQNAYEVFGWEKAEVHLPYPRSRPLNEVERKTLAKVTLPLKCDYSSMVTLVHCQGGGGCGGYTAAAVFDILKKWECPYAPNSSYRFQEYFYNESRKLAPELELNQLDVLQRLGCVPESRLPTNYDQKPAATPTKAHFAEAKAYRILRYSDVISPVTVDSLKRMLVLFGPLCAFGDVPGSPPNAHVFAVIGYDDVTRKFTILNSYGDGWGQNGMQKMPYESIERRPQTQQFARVTSIRYVINAPTPPGLYPYVAHLRIRHNESRNHLTVKIGVEGEEPATVWDRPNKTVVPDRSRNLVIDVPLPDYAARFWPPGPARRWFVEVADDSAAQSGGGMAGQIVEATLVDRTKAATRTGPPVLHKANVADLPLPKGGKVVVHIAN